MDVDETGCHVVRDRIVGVLGGWFLGGVAWVLTGSTMGAVAGVNPLTLPEVLIATLWVPSPLSVPVKYAPGT